jgi:hypothetical protein
MMYVHEEYDDKTDGNDDDAFNDPVFKCIRGRHG